jgi:outer membrane protein assembly factor BamB
MVFIGSKDGFVYALGTKTGELRWKTRTGDVVTSPVVFSEGVVYVQSGGTMALEGATGKIIWRAGLGGSVQGAPVVAEGVVYIAGGGGEVYALE